MRTNVASQWTRPSCGRDSPCPQGWGRATISLLPPPLLQLPVIFRPGHTGPLKPHLYTSRPSLARSWFFSLGFCCITEVPWHCCIVFFLGGGRTAGRTDHDKSSSRPQGYPPRPSYLWSLADCFFSSDRRVFKLVRVLSHAFSGTSRSRIERPIEFALCA